MQQAILVWSLVPSFLCFVTNIIKTIGSILMMSIYFEISIIIFFFYLKEWQDRVLLCNQRPVKVMTIFLPQLVELPLCLASVIRQYYILILMWYLFLNLIFKILNSFKNVWTDSKPALCYFPLWTWTHLNSLCHARLCPPLPWQKVLL